MNTRSKLLTGGVAVVALAVIAAFATWYFFIRSDSPPAVSLQGALDSIAASTPANAPSGLQTDAQLEGEWTVVKGANSFVGYRVGEELVGVGSVTAVGRTGDITGTLTYDGSSITDVEIVADLTTLTSDRTMRDGQLRTQGIETAKFPTATFVLTEAIDIDQVPNDGQTVTQTVSGQLTLHGVTRDIEIEVQGVIQSGQLVVVGSTEIQFADYDIAQPRAGSVLSIEDHGIMEFQLLFTKA